MSKITLYVPFLNFTFTPSCLEKAKHAFRTSYSRKKPDNKTVIELLQSMIPEDKKQLCSWCGEECNRIDFDFVITNNNCEIINVHYTTPLFVCYKSGFCEYKKLNPNSKEFVSKSRKLEYDMALQYIHTRNKSPFYRRKS